MNMTHYSLKNNKYIVISIFIIILIWQVVALKIDNRLLFPSFLNVLENALDILISKEIFKILISSISRCIYSFVISISIAIVLAIWSYYSKIIYNLLLPIISFMKSVPTMALIVLLLIWTSKNTAPVTIGVIISLPMLYEIILNSLINIDKGIVDVSRVYGFSKFNKIINIFIPIIVIETSKIINSNLSLIFKVVISAEVYSQPDYGIGAVIQWEKMQLNTPAIIAWMIIIGIISYLFDFILYKSLNKISFIGRLKNGV